MRDPPVYGNTETRCVNQTGLSIVPLLGVDGSWYPAYQVASGGDCYHLGGGITSEFMHFEPIDQADPSTGVTLVYTGGDSSMCGDRERSLRVSFYCMNNPTNLPTDSDIVEFPACTYNIRLESMFGCPVSCGEYMRTLCGGNGVCGYDRDRETARCFCTPESLPPISVNAPRALIRPTSCFLPPNSNSSGTSRFFPVHPTTILSCLSMRRRF